MRHAIHGVLLSALPLLSGACPVVSQLPVIRVFPPTWDADDSPKVISAVITQNNGPLSPQLRVRCDFAFATPPNQVPTWRSVDAEALAGNVWNCTLPDGLAVRNNHVLLFEWLVESTDQQGQPLAVARSDVREFHVGCADPAGFLRQEQLAVLQRFGGLTTLDRIITQGFVPTHTTTLPADIGGISVSTPIPVNKVFRGMGVAFARAQDILAAGNFVPSGTPQPGSPNLLLFLPSATVDGRPDLDAPGATYQLIGWAYAANLTSFPDGPPSVGCFPLHEWFFHEEGIHTLDGGFSPGAGSALGAPHARLWDLHVWADSDSGIPELGIFNVTGAGGATTPASGYEAPAGSFFYPEFAQP